MRYELPELEYGYADIAPVISEEIMKLHHDKHHAAYVTGANAALEKLEKNRAGELEIDVRAVLRDLSFNVNGHLLHSMLWETIRAPRENNMPTDVVMDKINEQFGSFEAFWKQFAAAAKAVEASGWAVLAADHEKNMFILQVEKQNVMFIAGFMPIMGIDVWEHAYYLDYKNDRAAYVDAFSKIIDWDAVNSRINSL